MGDKDKSGAVGNTVGESRLGDEWSLSPTSTICKGAKIVPPQKNHTYNGKFSHNFEYKT